MFKDYYHLLGVDKDASEKEIKHSFRTLAMEYHPDSTNAPDAHNIFLDINEAYQTLSDALKRDTYNRSYDYHSCRKGQQCDDFSYRVYTPPHHGSPGGYYQSLYISRKEMFVKGVSILSIFFVMFLCLDYFFAEATLPEVVQNGYLTVEPGGEMSCWIQTDEQNLALDYSRFERLGKGDIITLKTTPFFGVHTSLLVWRQQGENRTHVKPVNNVHDHLIKLEQIDSFAPHYGIYNVFSVVIFALLASASLGLFLQKNLNARVRIGMVSLLLLVINTFVLLQS